MKKKDHFVKRTFLSFLFLNILSRFGYFINSVIDTVSGGKILGEEALGIVSIISPSFYFISFFASLVGPGPKAASTNTNDIKNGNVNHFEVVPS